MTSRHGAKRSIVSKAFCGSCFVSLRKAIYSVSYPTYQYFMFRHCRGRRLSPSHHGRSSEQSLTRSKGLASHHRGSVSPTSVIGSQKACPSVPYLFRNSKTWRPTVQISTSLVRFLSQRSTLLLRSELMKKRKLPRLFHARMLE